MKQVFIFITTLLCVFDGHAQKVFFKSKQSYTASNLKTFYASITIKENLLLFNAPDYQLYAYDKTSGKPKWEYSLYRKSDIPPFFVQNFIWASSDEKVVQLDVATGKKIKELPFQTIESAPVLKNGIVYGTGLYAGGCLFAYDMKSDSVLWTRFLAHGCSVRPYYLSEKIIANAEGLRWLEVEYSGRLKDRSCETNRDVFPSELPCVKYFAGLTHDGKEINAALAESFETGTFGNPEILYSTKNTFILSNGSLKVLSNDLNMKSETDLSSLLEEGKFNDDGLAKILKADEEKVWILFGQQLMIFNYQIKKLVKAIDLRTWRPHQAILDNNRLWLISRKDGLLYGISTE